ncbi:MAG: hypothetical protein KGZ58_03680 [Ignavibacteriales bacterium]|nr:hypothetical protein [Ignavibacteriales bacterium]
MNRNELIEKTAAYVQMLHEDKMKEVLNFAEYLLFKQEEFELQEGIKILASQSKNFAFLDQEEEIYTKADLIERYK